MESFAQIKKDWESKAGLKWDDNRWNAMADVLTKTTEGKKLLSALVLKAGVDGTTFTAEIKKFSVKSTDSSPEFSIELGGITGISKKTQELVDNMNGAVVVTLRQAQSRLEFGKVPEGAKIESPADSTDKSPKAKSSKNK